jgi:hypothetical protein
MPGLGWGRGGGRMPGEKGVAGGRSLLLKERRCPPLRKLRRLLCSAHGVRARRTAPVRSPPAQNERTSEKLAQREDGWVRLEGEGGAGGCRG